MEFPTPVTGCGALNSYRLDVEPSNTLALWERLRDELMEAPVNPEATFHLVRFRLHYRRTE